jgi:hypothetical protein
MPGQAPRAAAGLQIPALAGTNVNSQQVIINRAFFINNRNVYRDFLHRGEQRTAFMDLLSSSVIVPYLVTESSPVQPQAFTVQSEGWQAWQRVISECSSSCLRLSWDHDENADTPGTIL